MECGLRGLCNRHYETEMTNKTTIRTRELFEAEFPVPERIRFIEELDGYVSTDQSRIFVRTANCYQDRWIGFQAGYKAKEREK